MEIKDVINGFDKLIPYETAGLMIKLVDVIRNGDFYIGGSYCFIWKNNLSFEILSKDGNGEFVNPNEGLGSVFDIKIYFHGNKENFLDKQRLLIDTKEQEFLSKYIKIRLNAELTIAHSRKATEQAELRKKILDDCCENTTGH